jgi:hypothetical protein
LNRAGARAAVWLGPVFVVVSAACAHTVNSVERLCTPGNYVFCRCKDSSEGTKLCKADGQSFEPCDACQPGQEEVPLDGDADVPPDLDSGPDDDVIETPDVPVVDAPPGVGTPQPGEVLISEVMYDPSGTEPDEEWVEVYNASSGPRLLNGLALKDGGNRTVTIATSQPIVLASKQYAVLVRSRSAALGAKIPAGAIVFEYGASVGVNQGVLLSNGTSGGVWLMDGTTVIGGCQYGGWFTQSPPGGHSIQLKTLTLDASGQQASWCLSDNAWASNSDLGTPGKASDCP